MNLSDRMEFGKIKQKWGNGKNLNDTEICMLFAWIENLIRTKEEQGLIIGRSRTGGKLK